MSNKDLEYSNQNADLISVDKINNKNHSILESLNSNNFNEKNFKEEAELIYNAINNGELSLDPTEKQNILDELDMIMQHFESGVDEESLDNNLDSNRDNRTFIENSKEGIAVISVDDIDEDLFKSKSNNDLIFSSSLDSSSEDLVSSEDIDISVMNNNDVFTDNNVSVDDALNELVDEYSNEIAIKVENISMKFKVSKDKIDTLKELFIRTLKRNKSSTRTLVALDNISFQISKGDRVGIIGFNGAGKSTLLKVLSGVYDATEGNIYTKGKIAPLLELGAGFDNNYTGKDNIFLNGAFLGYSEDFLKEKYDEILEFSELGDAINYHVKTYSSGMRAKLGFSIATIVEPDILILDEILSVGDIKFRRKSADKIKSLINSGITVLLVSHSVGQIRDLCNKAIWLDEGKLKMYGEVNEVCDAYIKAASSATKDQLKNIQLN